MNEKIKKCKYCNKEFEFTNEKQMYCSRNCCAYYNAKNKKLIYNKKCKFCNKDFQTRASLKIFCTKECLIKYYIKNPIKHKYNLKCSYCGKDYVKILANKPKENENHYCSQKCVGLSKNKNGINKTDKCKQCGKEFSKIHKRHFFCSNKCKSKYGVKTRRTKKVKCSNCNKTLIRISSLKNKNYFCSRKCESEFRIKNSNDQRTCETCGKTFYCKKHDHLRFCSIQCQGIWQSKFRSGKNHPSYKSEITDDMRVINCNYCGKEIKGTPKRFETRKYCSRSCMRKSTNMSMTKPHVITCDILLERNIEYIIEYPLERFSFDCYLPKYNLAIEVMGGFYHMDVRSYDVPINDIQKNSLRRDKRKQNLSLKKGIKILYLWEDDLYKRKNICKKLIIEFINNCGIIDNYHSMNYLIKNGELKLKDNILIPHFENKK